MFGLRKIVMRPCRHSYRGIEHKAHGYKPIVEHDQYWYCTGNALKR